MSENADKPLIIIGSSGHGIDIALVAKRLNANLIGYLDDAPENKGKKILGKPVLGKVDDWVNHPDCDFVIGIGDPRTRAEVESKMRSKGEPSFRSLIDPSVKVGDNFSIGRGSVLMMDVLCMSNVSVAEQVVVNVKTVLGHDVKVGAFSTIAPMSMVLGKVNVCQLAEVGACSVIRQGLTVANGSILGMGGVLVRDLKENEIAVGNPAKTLRFIQ